MSLTNAWETIVARWLFTAGSVSRPSSWSVGLFTVSPGEAGAGTEVSGVYYVRQAVTFTVSGNVATNAGALQWPVAGSNWGTVTHVGVFDNAGSLIGYGALATPRAVPLGESLRIPAGDLDITVE